MDALPGRHKIIPASEHARFGAYMKAVRLEAGFSQTELAHVLGLPQSYVSKVERGERQMQVLEFIKVCGALKLDPPTVLREFS